jgi:hypothetical protein
MSSARRLSGRAASVVVASIVAAAAITVGMFANGRDGRPAAGPDPATSMPATSTTATTPASTSTTAPIADVGHLDVMTRGLVDCGSQLPVSVEVPGLQPIEGAVPSTPPPDHQLVKHWIARDHTIELRWPADRRELSSPTGRVELPPLVGSWGTDGHTTSAYTHGTDMLGSQLFSLTDVDGFDLSRLPSACSEIQFRVTSSDGSRQTLGFGLPTAPKGSTVDLGPLVGLRRTSPEQLPRDHTLACPDRVQRRWTVTVDAPSTSPAEALRTFLESDAAAVVPQPDTPRPFEETFMENDGTYRYEHYLEWSTYVAITVAPIGNGWAVTNWESGAC